MAEALSSSSPARPEHYGLIVVDSFGNLGQPNRDCSMATGVAFNRDHEVLVADPSYNRIHIFTARGRLQREIRSSVPRAGMFTNPSKVAVNPKNGSIYVAECACNFGINMFNSNGFFVKSFGVHDNYSETRALTVDNENNVLLLEQRNTGEVFLFIIKENGHSYRHSLYWKLTSPNGLAAWDGKIYISDKESDFIKIFDYTGKQVGQFTRITKHAFGVCVSEAGEVLVGAQTYGGFKVTKFKTDGSFVSVHSSRTYHHDIRNMAVQGEFVVLATCDGIYIYGAKKGRNDLEDTNQAKGATIERTIMNLHHTFALQDSSGRLNTFPRGVAASRQPFFDAVYVSDHEHGRIQVFDRSGAYLGQFESRLTNPKTIIVDRRTNNVLVIDEGPQPHIVIFTCSGELINKIGIGFLTKPLNFDVDKHGKMFVIEYNSSFLKVFDRFGSNLYLLKCKGARFPTVIAISEKEEIFMTENDYHHIQVFNYSGELLRRIGNYALTKDPLFVAIVRDGLIVVADRSKYINLTYFTEEGTFVAAFQSNIKHLTCNGLSVMPDESIVISNDGSCCQIYIYCTNVNQ